MLEIILGQIPEAIYFSIFMILTKRLKKNRLLYMSLMIIEYVIIAQIFKYSVWFQMTYTICAYLILKIIYREKAQITDIFTFTIASIFLIISSAIVYFIGWKTIRIYNVCVVIHRIVLGLSLFIVKNRLPRIQHIYKKLWNRNDYVDKKIKSTTFRCINVVILNITFCIINLGMIFMIVQNGGA